MKSRARAASSPSREKKLTSRRKRRETCCRYCCVRLFIVFLGSSFSAFLLVLSHIESVEDQQSLRQQIVAAGLTAFVRDGAILPRNSGDTDTPMRGAGVVAFRSPEAMTREFKLPNCGAVRGMAIPRGVTLIVGGGFHGKSTLLQALELGVYDHIPGDGREFVVTDPTAVKVRGPPLLS